LNACLLRAANKTFTGHEEQHRSLIALALEHSNCGSFNSPNVRAGIPPGWDSPAFCSNLFTSGSLVVPVDASRVTDVFGNTRVVGGALPPLPRSQRGEAQIGGSLQARYYSRLVDLQPNPTASWIHLLNDRAEKIIDYYPCMQDRSLSLHAR
jgi:hypothetical protein